MTDTANTPAPKKSKKNLILLLVFILTILGIDYNKTHYIFGADVAITDSTIVITPSVSTTTATVVADSTKKDTVK